jgi:hypothetical protein
MSVKSGPFEASADESPKANGTTHHNGAGSSTTAVEQLALSLLRRQNKSTDERLAAIRQTIRTWETRGTESGEGGGHAAATATTAATAATLAPEPAGASTSTIAPEPTEAPTLVSRHWEPAWTSEPESPTEPVWASEPEPATEQIAAVGLAEDPDEIWYPARRWTSRLMIWVGAAGALAIALILVVTLLPSSSPSNPGGATPAPAQPATPAATQYLAAAKQIDLAEKTLTRGLNNTSDILRLPALSGVMTPYATALQSYETQLSKIHWPANAVSSGHALEAALRSYVQFLGTISTLTSPDLGNWLDSFRAHSAYVQNATNALRQELGLPG